METDEVISPRKRKQPQTSSVPKKKNTPVTTPTKEGATPTKGGATPTKQICKYGVKCYQTNKEHQDKFSHPWVRDLQELIPCK